MGLVDVYLWGQNQAAGNPNYFKNIAESWSNQKAGDVVVPVSTVSDWENILSKTSDITKLVYVGHASNTLLYLSSGNSLTASDLSSLNTNNLTNNAAIYLHGCKTALESGSIDSIAQSFANYFGRNTYGWDTGLSFGVPIIGLGSYTRHENEIFPADPTLVLPDYSNNGGSIDFDYLNEDLINSLYWGAGASGGFVLYPNKTNTNMMNSVYAK